MSFSAYRHYYVLSIKLNCRKSKYFCGESHTINIVTTYKPVVWDSP